MDRTHIRYIFIYTFSYMAIGSMMPLIGRYLAQEGFTGAQIGTVTAAGTLVAALPLHSGAVCLTDAKTAERW